MKKKVFKKKVFVSLVIVIIIATIFALQYGSDQPVNKGENYLMNVYDKDVYLQDIYLMYEYPNENLKSPSDRPITYRILDAYFDMFIINEKTDDSNGLREPIKVALADLSALVPIWETNVWLFNVQNPIEEHNKDPVALDTYCILGYLYNSSKMADVVLIASNGTKWLSPQMYEHDDQWRQIADEVWCIMLLAKTKVDDSTTEDHVNLKMHEIKIFETYNFEGVTAAAAELHIVMMLTEAAHLNGTYVDLLSEYQNKLIKSMEKEECWANTLLIANVLTSLIDSKYTNKTTLEKYYNELIVRQTPKGAWYPIWHESQKEMINSAFNEQIDNGQAFTTMRAIIAMESYDEKY